MVFSVFSQTLRESTRQVHDRAHHSRYMNALLSGSLTLDGYTRLATQHYFIYRALEETGAALAGDAVGAPFVIDELHRTPALAADLEFLIGPDWQARIEPLPATQEYVHRVHTVARHWAGGYVAHHYTRYLGDLAGGQVVGALLQRRYGIAGPGALFYDFTSVGNPHAFRLRYRALLDQAPWDEAERNRVVEETLAAFELNIAVLDDLAEGLEEYLAA
ncbi:biliverdin-producing heme oxygenase [Saccharomonospora sp. NPDC046836]|uniref:biliverdin-producing heme oxygenase n=1 Tax=Saccharomonospora sp. NPDC046836 TaxID=3156921 RepID=UPI0033F54BD6